MVETGSSRFGAILIAKWVCVLAWCGRSRDCTGAVQRGKLLFLQVSDRNRVLCAYRCSILTRYCCFFFFFPSEQWQRGQQPPRLRCAWLRWGISSHHVPLETPGARQPSPCERIERRETVLWLQRVCAPRSIRASGVAYLLITTDSWPVYVCIPTACPLPGLRCHAVFA